MHHRLQFHEGNKAEILRDANRLTIIGMSAMAIAMTGAVMLVTDYVFSGATMIACVVGVSFAFLVVWYGMPARRLIAKHQGD